MKIYLFLAFMVVSEKCQPRALRFQQYLQGLLSKQWGAATMWKLSPLVSTADRQSVKHPPDEQEHHGREHGRGKPTKFERGCVVRVRVHAFKHSHDRKYQRVLTYYAATAT